MCHGRRHLSEGGVALWAGAVGAFKSVQRERGRESTALLVFQPCALSVRVWELGATAAVGVMESHLAAPAGSDFGSDVPASYSVRFAPTHRRGVAGVEPGRTVYIIQGKKVFSHTSLIADFTK